AFVMPRFVEMYADLGSALPLPTRMLMSVVERFYVVGPAVAAAVALGVWSWRRWASSDAARRRLDRARERLPWIGDITCMATTAQLARSLAALLAGGTPLVEALRTAGGAVERRTTLDRLELATRQVTEGASLAQAVRATALMPPMAARMIEVGEASG